MENKIVIAAFVIVLFVTGMGLAFLGFAETARITIFSPDNDSTVAANDVFRLGYEAVPGYEGAHLFLNVDGRRMSIVRRMNGIADVGPLSPGKHRVCLAISTQSNVPTGVERCISVAAR